MHVRSISIRREGDHSDYHTCDPSKPFVAKVRVEGDGTESTLTISPELSMRIVGLIAEEIAAAGRMLANALTAEAFSGQLLSAPTRTTIDGREIEDDPIPF